MSIYILFCILGRAHLKKNLFSSVLIKAIILHFAILWYLLVCSALITWPKQLKPWKVLVIDSIMLAGMLIHWALLYSRCDLTATEMNIQCSLIKELMLYEFKMGHNVTEATKNICCVKSEGTFDQNTVNRRFKNFCTGCKKIRQGWVGLKLNSEAMTANPVSSTLRVSDELSISQSIVVQHLQNLNKSIKSWQIVSYIIKILKTFLLSVHSITLVNIISGAEKQNIIWAYLMVLIPKMTLVFHV